MKVIQLLTTSHRSKWLWLPALFVGLGIDPANNRSTAADARDYEKTIKPILAKHCLACHGENATAKRLRLDRLAPGFAGERGEHWSMVFDRVRSGEMPPKKKPPLTAAERKQVQDWLQSGLRAAGEARKKAEGRVPLRRLNRVEYQNTIRHLLAIDTELKELLPEDNAVDGFDNNADGLTVSAVLMQRYLEAAEAALDAARIHSPRPPAVKKRFTSFAYDQPSTAISNSATAYRLGDDSVFFLDREIEHQFGGQDVLPRLPKGFPLPLKSGGALPLRYLRLRLSDQRPSDAGRLYHG
jgi:mono/diheme cytochrome c family protein